MNSNNRRYCAGLVVVGVLLIELLQPPGALDYSYLLFLQGFMVVVGTYTIFEALAIVTFGAPHPVLAHLCGAFWLAIWFAASDWLRASELYVANGLSDKLWCQAVGILSGWMICIEFPEIKRKSRRARGNNLFTHLLARLHPVKSTVKLVANRE